MRAMSAFVMRSATPLSKDENYFEYSYLRERFQALYEFARRMSRRKLMAARPYLQDDGSPLEPELLAQLVLQVPLVGEVQIHLVVEGDHEGRRGHADLG